MGHSRPLFRLFLIRFVQFLLNKNCRLFSEIQTWIVGIENEFIHHLLLKSFKCGRHSSVVKFAPTILRPKQTIYAFFNLYCKNCNYATKKGRKEAGIGSF